MRSRRPVAKKTTRMSLDAGPPQVSEKEVQAAEVQVAAEDMTDRFGLVRDDCDLSLRAPGGATIEAMARPAPGLVRTTPARKPRTEWDCHSPHARSRRLTPASHGDRDRADAPHRRRGVELFKTPPRDHSSRSTLFSSGFAPSMAVFPVASASQTCETRIEPAATLLLP